MRDMTRDQLVDTLIMLGDPNHPKFDLFSNDMDYKIRMPCLAVAELLKDHKEGRSDA